MHCPIDNTTLARADREGVEIDYCPSCRGVWLDRGELDKIIERSGSAHLPPTRPRSRTASTGTADTTDADPDYDRDNDDGQPQRTDRRSFLADLFDF